MSGNFNDEDSPLPFFSPMVPAPTKKITGSSGSEKRAADENEEKMKTRAITFPRELQVLLVEDNPGDRRIIEELLNEVEGVHFELVPASTLAEGIKRLNGGRFDVVLLDLTLPDCRGLASFLGLHRVAPTVPVVVMTGFHDEILGVKAVQEGAEDYLVKGYVTSNLLARALRYAIERNRRRQAERALRETSEQFRAARVIQQHLFPRCPPELPGYDLAGLSEPAEATGGDYYDFVPILDGSIGIAVGDVSGHGFASALLMASTRAYLRALAQTHNDVGTILTLTNRVLCQDVADDRYISLFYARLDLAARTLIYASAGHPTGYLLNSQGIVRAALASTEMPLGVIPDCRFQASEPLQLDQGDTVLLITDGVMEQHRPDEEMFGIERVLEMVRQHRTASAKEIAEQLFAAVRAFSQNAPRHDDLTAVVLKVL